MFLIVGLGNPGEKYKNTRHNIGFQVIDEFARKNNFSQFRFSKKFNAAISEITLNGKKIILAKPKTFMNLSGKSVKALITFYKISGTVPVIIHDDIDLPLGKLRIVKNQGAAGHKGVQSIINEIGIKNFIRFRVGIQPISKLKTQSAKLQFKTKNLEGFVLKKFSADEEKIVKDVIKKITEAIEMVLKEGLEKAMSNFNK